MKLYSWCILYHFCRKRDCLFCEWFIRQNIFYDAFKVLSLFPIFNMLRNVSDRSCASSDEVESEGDEDEESSSHISLVCAFDCVKGDTELWVEWFTEFWFDFLVVCWTEVSGSDVERSDFIFGTCSNWSRKLFNLVTIVRLSQTSFWIFDIWNDKYSCLIIRFKIDIIYETSKISDCNSLSDCSELSTHRSNPV